MCREMEKWSMEERQEGRQEGCREGESRLTTLLKLLKADGRLQDLDLAIEMKRYGKNYISNTILSK